MKKNNFGKQAILDSYFKWATPGLKEKQCLSGINIL